MPLSDGLQDDVILYVPLSDPRWQVVERIVSSPNFQRSERLKAFLKYVAAQYLTGHPERLTGHQIGQAVFGKNAQDPTEDNAVRVHARQLRLRLLEYFDTYGREEPYIIEIPKGSYIPVFRPTQATPVAAAEPEPADEPALEMPATKSQRGPLFKSTYLPWALVAALAITLVILCVKWPRAQFRPAAFDIFETWPLSEFGLPNQQTQIVVCDNSFALYEVAANRPHTLADYLSPDYPHNILTTPERRDQGVDGLLDQLGRKQLTSYADSAAAVRIARMNLPGTWLIRPARDIKLREVQEGNFIFFGSAWSNPWVELYEPRLNYVPTMQLPWAIANRHPQPGEPAAYLSRGRTGSFGDDYAAIALIPNEKRGLVMILQGTKEEGTEAAGSFITDPQGRSALRDKLHLQPSEIGHGHVYFEALLLTKIYAGASAQTELVAARRIAGR